MVLAFNTFIAVLSRTIEMKDLFIFYISIWLIEALVGWAEEYKYL